MRGYQNITNVIDIIQNIGNIVYIYGVVNSIKSFAHHESKPTGEPGLFMDIEKKIFSETSRPQIKKLFMFE